MVSTATSIPATCFCTWRLARFKVLDLGWLLFFPAGNDNSPLLHDEKNASLERPTKSPRKQALPATLSTSTPTFTAWRATRSISCSPPTAQFALARSPKSSCGGQTKPPQNRSAYLLPGCRAGSSRPYSNDDGDRTPRIAILLRKLSYSAFGPGTATPIHRRAAPRRCTARQPPVPAPQHSS